MTSSSMAGVAMHPHQFPEQFASIRLFQWRNSRAEVCTNADQLYPTSRIWQVSQAGKCDNVRLEYAFC